MKVERCKQGRFKFEVTTAATVRVVGPSGFV